MGIFVVLVEVGYNGVVYVCWVLGFGNGNRNGYYVDKIREKG